MMPNKDRHHDVVINALQKSGWTIVQEQVYISVGETTETMRHLYIDIQAQRDDTVLVLIEVKALDVSPVHQLRPQQAILLAKCFESDFAGS